MVDYIKKIVRTSIFISILLLVLSVFMVTRPIGTVNILLMFFGYILVVDTLDEAISVANDIASEHLEIVTKNPFDVMTKIRNAGAIFLGEYSSEPLGDYFAGPNHVLPTNGTAKFFSPLSVDDFIKKSSIISYSRQALEPISEDIQKFAKAEGLTAHANSIRVRFDENDEI